MAEKDMTRIVGIKKQTENRFLNMYDLTVTHRNGKTGSYYVASRAESEEGLAVVERELKAAAVLLYGTLDGKLVLERQFRYPIDDYIYELPAGLIEEGESLTEAAKREAFEETGLHFEPLEGGICSRPFYMSPGMTDEACATIYGYYTGEPTSIHEEEDEDIQVVIADKEECRRILAEEKVALSCAFRLMQYISSDDPFDFVKKITE